MTVVSTRLHTVDTAEQYASPYPRCQLRHIWNTVRARKPEFRSCLKEESLETLDPLQTCTKETRFLRAQMFGRAVERYWR